MELTTQNNKTPAGQVIGEPGERIWGMTSAQRLERIFKRLGLGASGADGVVAAHAGWVFDESLIRALAQRPGVILVDDAGVAAAVHARSADDAAIASLGGPPPARKWR